MELLDGLLVLLLRLAYGHWLLLPGACTRCTGLSEFLRVGVQLLGNSCDCGVHDGLVGAIVLGADDLVLDGEVLPVEPALLVASCRLELVELAAAECVLLVEVGAVLGTGHLRLVRVGHECHRAQTQGGCCRRQLLGGRGEGARVGELLCVGLLLLLPIGMHHILHAHGHRLLILVGIEIGLCGVLRLVPTVWLLVILLGVCVGHVLE